ncbi:Protein of unknown function [Shimia gijangensis]|uniref:DUF2927 domain-containing protein n=1 Tax=Shimia gijangensis TaxID=1470563 RepID=A0A1M6FWG9_9RHOB|nr:DUF2927 domain-containing protein [Shimia gijangensis]SHJ02022.1 Protein of unknown function [Shimia gijangensis]
MTLTLAALAACQGLTPGSETSKPAISAPRAPSANSAALRAYYVKVEADLIARGLLRTDGGGPDTPYTSDMLARNFEQIAFYDEYAPGRGLRKSSGRAGQLRRWSGPVRIGVEYGASVPVETRNQDDKTVSSYVRRIAGITGRPISMNGGRANFHVLVMGEDDRSQLLSRLRQIIPGVSPSTLGLFTDPPRGIHCLVAAFPSEKDDNDYRTAVALVRAEHPDLLRKSCYHEEIAQGLGLANDSPNARPSIFNDDDEFALLTTHDEALLSMLYDPRLSIGMTLDTARPVINLMAREKAGRLY